MTTHINSNLGDLDQHLATFEDEPTLDTIIALESALAATFAQTQADTDVITGSLKGSGKTSSEVRDGQWVGEITYGGPSPGFPNAVVDYAQYERARGEGHDYFRSVRSFDRRYETVMEGLGDA